MQFAPYDYLSDRPAPGRGLLPVAKLLQRLTKDFLSRPGTSVLLVDNGDAFQGSPVSDAVGLEAEQVHPMIAAMNDLGYDAVTPGNHDFTYGLDFLDDLSRNARFPFVASNLVRTRDLSGPQDAPGFKTCALIDKAITAPDGTKLVLRIGIVGFAPPQTVQWESYSVGTDLEGFDIVETARKTVPRLREAGADIVVALAHSGIAGASDTDIKENATAQLAKIDGIDAIIAGHVHKVFPGPDWNDFPEADPTAGSISAIPVVMPGAFGSHLGRIDLELTHDGEIWSVQDFECRAETVDIEETGSDTFDLKSIEQVTSKTHEATLRYIRRKVGHTPSPINSFFVLAAPSNALTISARALSWFAREETSLEQHGLPILAAVSPFRAGGFAGATGYVDIPEGPLLQRHATELFPFPNDLCAVVMDGRQLAEWLNRASRIFAPIAKGRHRQSLIDPSVPAYQFDVIHGLTYAIDPSRRTDRIGDIRFADGRKVGPDDRAILLTNSYRTNGGGGYVEAGEAHSTTRFDAPLTEIIAAYFGSVDFNPSPQEVWHFASIPDTSATFLSGSGSETRLGDVEGRSIRHDGSADNGFQRFVIDF